MSKHTERNVQVAKPSIKDDGISDGGARGVGRLLLPLMAASAGGTLSQPGAQ